MPGLVAAPRAVRHLNHSTNRGTVSQHFSAQHNARTCNLCAPLRHPSQWLTRRALAALPHQSAPASGRRENGEAR